MLFEYFGHSRPLTFEQQNYYYDKVYHITHCFIYCIYL